MKYFGGFSAAMSFVRNGSSSFSNCRIKIHFQVAADRVFQRRAANLRQKRSFSL
jgi:hypothetical protein